MEQEEYLKESKKYTNGEVTINWQPKLCIHSKHCWSGKNSLPEVFNPAVKPWIKPENATTKRIIEQIKRCPSGALSYEMNNENKKETTISTCIVEPIANGPLIVRGNITLINADGSETKREHSTSFCRCGASLNQPFCDGSHETINFKT